MKRYELLHEIKDASQAAAFMEKFGQPCNTKANGANWKTWCRSYGSGKDACRRCKVDYWNEEVEC